MSTDSFTGFLNTWGILQPATNLPPCTYGHQGTCSADLLLDHLQEAMARPVIRNMPSYKTIPTAICSWVGAKLSQKNGYGT